MQLASLKSVEETKKQNEQISPETPLKSKDSTTYFQNNLLNKDLAYLQESQNQIKESIKTTQHIVDFSLKKISDNESSFNSMSKLLGDNTALIEKQKDKIDELEKNISSMTKAMESMANVNDIKKLQFRVDDIDILATRITKFLNEENEGVETSQKKMLLKTMDKLSEMKKWNDDALTLIFKL